MNKNIKTAIVIPARYGSTRFPGKPLAMIAGMSMLERVYRLAKTATTGYENVDIIVASEDQRIIEHAESFGATAVMTPDTCQTGTDRCYAAIQARNLTPDIVLNLQGDAPLTPPHFITEMIDAFNTTPKPDVVTPAYQLTWQQLDDLRTSKETTPFSGTTLIQDQDGYALWFSKNIIPALRKEEEMRKTQTLSPIIKHIGLYAYTMEALTRYIDLPQSRYEQFEGLEQLRLLENKMRIKAVIIDPKGAPIHGGIDSPEDIIIAERILAKDKTA